MTKIPRHEMRVIKTEFFRLLDNCNEEALGRIKTAITDGLIKGNVCYLQNSVMPNVSWSNWLLKSKECGCLFAHAGNARYDSLPMEELEANLFYWRKITNVGDDTLLNPTECSNTLENFIFRITPGNTPENDKRMAKLQAWLKEWEAEKGVN